MSPVEQVLTAAKQLNTSGKTPSVALLKSKLGNSIPMPIIVQGLQRFKSLSKDEIEALKASQAAPQDSQQQPQVISLEALYQEVQQLRIKQQLLIEKVAQLESALQQKDVN